MTTEINLIKSLSVQFLMELKQLLKELLQLKLYVNFIPLGIDL